MAKELSLHYNEPCVSEFAIDYLEDLDRPYEYDDLKHIAIGQLILQNRIHQFAKNFLFLDTDLTVIKVWSDYKYGKTDLYVEYLLKSNVAHLYLLLDTDLPYEDNKYREHPDLDDRNEIFQRYEKQLKKMDANYAVITGSLTERFQQAVQLVESQFNQPEKNTI